VGTLYHCGSRHWKTEIVGSSVEMLSGRRKRDYEAESLAGQAAAATDTDHPTEETGDAAVSEAQAEAEDASSDEDEQALVLA
jgi:single-stranded DNA-binding protein